MFGKSYVQRHRGLVHIIENGNVGCPRSGVDVDIDRCYNCSAFRDLVTEDGVEYLYCRPQMPELAMSQF